MNEFEADDDRQPPSLYTPRVIVTQERRRTWRKGCAKGSRSHGAVGIFPILRENASLSWPVSYTTPARMRHTGARIKCWRDTHTSASAIRREERCVKTARRDKPLSDVNPRSVVSVWLSRARPFTLDVDTRRVCLRPARNTYRVSKRGRRILLICCSASSLTTKDNDWQSECGVATLLSRPLFFGNFLSPSFYIVA